VSADVLLAYAQALGGLPVLLQLVFLYLLIEGARVSASFWLSFWTQHSGSDAVDKSALELLTDLFAGRHTGHRLRQPHTTTYYLAIYCAISGAQVCSAFLCVQRACVHLHLLQFIVNVVLSAKLQLGLKL
jgi:hypothetical protein